MARQRQKDIDRDDQKKVVMAMLAKGMTQKEIAWVLNVSATTIRARMRELGCLDPNYVARGMKAKETASAKGEKCLN